MLIFLLEVSSVYRMPDVDARLIIIFQEACQETGPRMRWSWPTLMGENMRALVIV